MQSHHAELTLDDPNHPAFLVVHSPPAPAEIQGRISEWVLATWLNQLDPHILGVRRVGVGTDGVARPTLHVAIPLEYPREELAQALAVEQLDDEENTPRVDLISSTGLEEPHSYISVPADDIVKELVEYVHHQILDSLDVNRHEAKSPGRAEEHRRASQTNPREEESRLRSAVREGLSLRKVMLQPDHIEILVNKKDGQRWVRIKGVAKSVRTALRLAIKQAGVRTVSTPQVEGADSDSDWAVLFSVHEATKLFSS